MTQGDYIQNAQEIRSAWIQERGVIFYDTVVSLAKLGTDDFDWQTQQRGVSHEGSYREVEDNLDIFLKQLKQEVMGKVAEHRYNKEK